MLVLAPCTLDVLPRSRIDRLDEHRSRVRFRGDSPADPAGTERERGRGMKATGTLVAVIGDATERRKLDEGVALLAEAAFALVHGRSVARRCAA